MQAGDGWDLLRVIQIVATVLTPFILAWVMLATNDRRKAMAEKLESMEKQSRFQLGSIERQIIELRDEQKEGRKECSEDVRAIMAQISEYPRRREMQEGLSELWQYIRGRGGHGDPNSR